MNDVASNPESQRPNKRSGAFWWKIGAWICASLLLLVGIAIGTVAILLQNARFHQYILTTVQQKASDSLGVPVHLQNFALNLGHLDLDLYGLTVEGAAPYANPPLLQVDHVEAGIRIISLVQRSWYMNSVQIDRPIVHLYVDEHGVSNLPKLKSSGTSSSNTSIFDLAIRRAMLDRGEIYYNDRRNLLSADLHDLEFQASYNVLFQKYSGKLSYSDGHLISGSLRPIPHDLDAEFDATPKTFHLTRAKLSSGPSQILISATLNNYAMPQVDGNYDVIADGAQLRQILVSTAIPVGQIHARGHVSYQQAANRSLFESIAVQGDLSSKKLGVEMTSLHSQITDLAAHYSLMDGNAVLQDIHASLLGGRLAGAGTMSNIAGDSHVKVSASLHGISLAELDRLSGSSTGKVGVSGALNAELGATWGKSLADLVANADASIDGHVQKTSVVAATKGTNNSTGQTADSEGIPVDGKIHGVYTANKKELTLNSSYLRTPQTNLTLNGVVSNKSSLNVRLQADDLHEVESVADLFRTTQPGQPLQPLGLAGTASFQGQVQGSTTAPHLTGQLVASNFQVDGSEWKILRTDVDVSPSLASVQHLDLEPKSRGRITLNASAGLTKWSFSNESPIQVEVNASQLNIAELSKLAGQQLPVTGTLAANVKLHGTELRPVGNGSVSIAGLVAYDQPIPTAKVDFAGTGDEAHAELTVQLPAGNLKGQVSVRPDQKTYIAKLTAAGIRLDKLEALKARNVDATGELSIQASGQGSFDNPALEATVQIPQLVMQQQTIKDLTLRANVADHVANATLTSSALNTNIQAKAKVNLSGDYLTDATLDTQSIPIQPILAIYAPEQAENLTGQTEVHATLHGPLKNSKLLEGHITIPVLKVAYGKSVQLAVVNPIHVDYKNGIVNVQRSTIHGTDTDLQFQGSIPVMSAASAPMSVMLEGTVNLQLAQLFDPDVRSSGELKLHINSNGPADSNSFGGQIDIVDAALATVDAPVGLQHGNGVLTFTNNRLSISKFQGTVGGGTVTAQGGVALRPNVQFDLGLNAQGIRMLYPQGMRESVDANVRLAGSTDSAVLGGQINLSDVSFTSAFDLNNFISQFTGGVATPPTPGLSQNLQLNLSVRSSNNLNLVSRTLSVAGTANLQVRGTAANPVILGRINLDNGDIILNGDRFLLNGGTVEFVNPSETEPVLNLSLKTTIQQYDVYLRFNGPIDQLRTNYNSDPALPSADIINLLAFGQTTEAAATASASTSTNQAAASLVASQVSSQVTSRVSKIAGISQLSINPVLGAGSTQGLGANITIQQRVTGNLFVTFTNNVGSTQSQTIQGQYQLSPRVALSATRDQNGGVAFDTIIKKSW